MMSDRRPVRILFPFAGDTGLGGSHISALTLAAALDRDLYEPYVLVHFQPGAVGAYAKSLGLDVDVLEGPRLMGAPGQKMENDIGLGRYLAATLPRLTREVLRIDPAIIHTNEGRMHANWIFPARITGRKHIWHHRQDPTAKGVNTLAPLLSHHIVSVSEFSKPSDPVLGIDRKFSVIRSPFKLDGQSIDRKQARDLLRAELGLPADAVILGYFGAIIDRKRPLLFVEALSHIVRALPGRAVHGAIFGEVPADSNGPDLQSLSDLAAKLGIADRLHLMGFRRDVGTCMSAVDATLVTAVNEPFGRTLIEAMHFGTPVIATRHGGNPEAIEHGVNGFLVEPENPAAFVAPLLDLLNDPALCARITTEARRRAATSYGEDRHVEEVSRLYRTLVPEG